MRTFSVWHEANSGEKKHKIFIKQLFFISQNVNLCAGFEETTDAADLTDLRWFYFILKKKNPAKLFGYNETTDAADLTDLRWFFLNFKKEKSRQISRV